MQAQYYDRDGRPVSEQRWQELGRQPGYSRTAYQRVWGWADITAARAGHQAVTAWIDQVAAFLAGHARQLRRAVPVQGADSRSKAVQVLSESFGDEIEGGDMPWADDAEVLAVHRRDL